MQSQHLPDPIGSAIPPAASSVLPATLEERVSLRKVSCLASLRTARLSSSPAATLPLLRPFAFVSVVGSFYRFVGFSGTVCLDCRMKGPLVCTLSPEGSHSQSNHPQMHWLYRSLSCLAT